MNVWLGGEMMTHLVHHYTAWAIVLFTSGHLYMVTRAEFMEGESEVSSMFSGSKLLEHVPVDASDVEDVFDGNMFFCDDVPYVKLDGDAVALAKSEDVYSKAQIDAMIGDIESCLAAI